MAPPHRVILVREWDAQTSGSGCCGRLGGADCEIGDGSDYAHNRAEMEAMGGVYRALRAELPREIVDITVVDPRNMVWLLPAMWRDGRARGMARADIWRQMRRGVSYNAVVVDGRVLFAGTVPDPHEAVTAVLAELGRAMAERG